MEIEHMENYFYPDLAEIILDYLNLTINEYELSKIPTLIHQKYQH